MTKTKFLLLILFTSILFIQTDAYASSPIVITRDSTSPTSQVNILIHAPDFNSDPNAIDTIGDDQNKIVISTREGSIPYRLVETGPDTGDFAGYIILSSTTSDCNPVCGPTDGYLAASGDDAITVSLIYSDGTTITNRLNAPTSNAIPEFPLAPIVLIISIASVILFSKKF